ncbi:MAG TPA: phosphatidate cytidylyltransferase [Candidatus Binataceae bacterium]|nr:phosphatidate cytidylyltransferase [Candidatus Binataceae bacterium]
MLQTRLKTAAILLPAVLAIILFAPATAFTAFIAIVTLWGLYETAEMVDSAERPWIWIALLGIWSVRRLAISGAVWWPWLAIVAGSASYELFSVGREGAEEGRFVGWSLTYPFWVAVLFPYFALLRNGQNGIAALILVLLLVVASDSGAYFTGRSLGRIKLLPKVSPNKTVEGAIGGLLATVLGGLLLRNWLVPELSAGQIVVLGIATATLAQVGDLVNSAFKRIARVKDSGWIFPGHGGLLDRTCSLVFPVTFAYYYLRLVKV